MAQQKGSTALIAVGFESTYNTAATNGFLLPVNSINIKPVQAVNKPNTLTGTRNPVQPFRGNKDVSGTIVVPMDSVAMCHWMQALIGTPVTTGIGPYVHEFKIGTTIPSLTIEEGFTDLTTDKYMRYTGCKLSGGEMSVGGDGELVMTFNVMGSGYSIETSPFDAVTPAVPLSRISNFQAALTEGGSGVANAQMISFRYDNQLDGDTYVIGSSGVRGALNEGVVGVGGNLEMLCDDAAMAVLAKGIAATESSLKMTATASATSVFEIEMQEVEFGVTGPDITGPQGLKLNVDYQAFYANGSEASAFVVRITNNEALAVATSESPSPSSSASSSPSASPSPSA